MEQTAGSVMGIIIGLLLTTAANTLVIWVVATTGLGIEIEHFGIAFFAAFLSAVAGFILMRLTTGWTANAGTNYGGILLHILASVLVLMLVSKLLSGMRTNGFIGAIIAATSIGVIYWIIGLITELCTLLVKSKNLHL
jgi:uncharacterized membrane protein YvlD (DUF360 family)